MQNALQITEDLTEQFLKTFTAKTGVHIIAQKKDGQMRQYFTKDLLSQQYADRENIYVTYNTSKKWNRRKSNVCAISALVIDIDYYKSEYKKWQVLNLLPTICDDENIFYPTSVIDSGNGLYFIWKLEEQIVNNQVMVQLYEKITKTLQAKLAFIGADAKACDILHLFRMPGTINTKNNQRKEVFVEYLNPEAIFELQDFTNEVLEELPQAWQKRAKTPKNGPTRASVKKLFNPYSLAKTRVSDLERLAQMRDFNMDGCRHNFLHIYAVQLTQAKHENFEQKLNEMNDLLTNPAKANDVKAIIKTLQDKAKNGGNLYASSYLYKNETIVSHLDINEIEQQAMRTIIDADEYKKRQRLGRNERYSATKTRNQQAKEERNKKICEMAQEGITQKQIAEAMAVTTRTVRNVLKAEKDAN